MASSRSDGDLTREELGLVQTALQSREFRNLLLDYVREVNEPHNRACYEADVIRAERERGFDVTFVHPDPCYVLKTTSTRFNDARDHQGIVAFVNVASSVCIDKPSCRRISVRTSEDDDGQVHWTIPHSFSPPRDVDMHDKKGVVYDCVFHPDTLQLAASNQCFKEMIEDIAMDGIEYNFEVKLDRTATKRHKSKYKGPTMATIIRRPLPPQSTLTVSTALSTTGDEEVQVPEHAIKYRQHIDMQDFAYGVSNDDVNKELVVDIHLPLVSTSDEVHLDIQPNELFLKSLKEATGHRYALQLKLPCAVREDDGRAQFDSERKILTVVLPTYVAGSGSKIEAESKIQESTACEERITAEVFMDATILAQQLADIRMVDEAQCTSAAYSKHLLLPDFSCHQDEQEIVFVLKTEKVHPQSLKVDNLHDGMASQIRYCTVGEGGLMFNYALFLRFPCLCKVDEGATSISVNQDSVVVIFKKFLTARNNWNDYFYDTDGTHELIEGKIEISSLQESLNALWNESKIAADHATNPLPVTITEVNSERIVMDIRAELTSGVVSQETSLLKKPAEDSTCPSSESTSCYARPIHVTGKFRSVSESSAVDTTMGSSARRMLRGILKYPGRVRTMSESSDDFNWSSVDYTTMDSDILEEEGSESGAAGSGGGGYVPKKSVHFNNNITKTLFRINSSIVGQRKKNQRRQRKLAVEQQRRTSENESEGDVATLTKQRLGTTHRHIPHKNTIVGPKVQFHAGQNGKLKYDNETKTKVTMDKLNGNENNGGGGQSNNNDNAPCNNKGRKHKSKRARGAMVNQPNRGSEQKVSSS